MPVFRPNHSAQKKDVQVMELCATADTQSIYAELCEALREGGEKGAFRGEAIINQLINPRSMLAVWHILENAPSYASELATMRRGYEARNKPVPESVEIEFVSKYSTPDHLIAVVEVTDANVRVRTYGLEKGMVLAALLKERLINARICNPDATV